MKEDEASNHRAQSHCARRLPDERGRRFMLQWGSRGLLQTSHGRQADHRLFRLEASGSRSLQSPESRKRYFPNELLFFRVLSFHPSEPHAFGLLVDFYLAWVMLAAGCLFTLSTLNHPVVVTGVQELGQPCGPRVRWDVTCQAAIVHSTGQF